MALTIVTLQFHYEDCFVSDPTLRDLNQEQSPLVEEQAPAHRVEEHSDSDSLYDVDENIDDLSDLNEELLQARQSNIQEQVKEKADRVNLDEIPSGPVGIDADFEDIYKEMRGRFEGNLGGDDLYFDSSDPNSDISEDEWDPVENDEVVDPAPRKERSDGVLGIYRQTGRKTGGVKKGEENSGRLPGHHLRAYFKEHSKCDVVENNMCETFNS
ncbi:hypothetical protein KY285_010258 [Solanum tuberosum]|nr:hypothetical protein KY289_010796 [Solanum tuberosum]KAH0734551.1 hypothetical protein KY285_010258 [Solanum tuberosum]